MRGSTVRGGLYEGLHCEGWLVKLIIYALCVCRCVLPSTATDRSCSFTPTSKR